MRCSHLIRSELFDFAAIFLEFIDNLFKGGSLSIILNLNEKYLCIESSRSFTSRENAQGKSFYEKVKWHSDEFAKPNGSWQTTQHTTALCLAQCIHYGEWQVELTDNFSGSINDSSPFAILLDGKKLYVKW
jgi:hypothetical protein